MQCETAEWVIKISTTCRQATSTRYTENTNFVVIADSADSTGYLTADTVSYMHNENVCIK